MNKKWNVYIHISPNSKYYVGITSCNVNRRWRNGKGYRQHIIFNRAINKYGWDNFQHEIIATNLTETEAKSFEKLLIKLLKSNDGVHGYNCTAGGDGTCNAIYSKERNLKISIAHKGVPMVALYKQVICVTTGEIFGSLKSGAKKYSIDPSSVSKVCRGINKHAGTFNGDKLKWKYKGEINDL